MRAEADRRVRERTEVSRNEDRTALEDSLGLFVEAAWPSFDPSEYQPCWAIDALCEHLQAVTSGQIRRLLINFPPRCAKTSVASICYPAWIWARRELSYLSGPQVRFLCGSYNHELALTNSNMTRRLILSPWYQSLWGDRFVLRQDQNTKTKFDTSAGGSRIATSVGGSLLGIGGDIIIIDDPHNTEQVESEPERAAALRWWKEISTTRLNDPKQSPLIVIMQRLHEDDVSGNILMSEWSAEWCHLMIPMEYEWKRHCVTVLGWQDPRGIENGREDALVVVDEQTGERLPRDNAAQLILDDEREGELMWPERFGDGEISRIKAELGPYMASGRLQQMPVPDKGGIFERAWWQLWDPPNGGFPLLEFIIASLDGAYTEKEENDPCAMTVWGVFQHEGKSRIMLLDAWRKHLKFSADRKLLEPIPPGEPWLYYADHWRRNPKHIKWYERTVEHWGMMEWVFDTCKKRRVHKLLIEAKAPGISAAQELVNRFGQQSWGVQLVPVKGDKVARALAVQPTFSQQLIYAPAREWAEMVIDEMAVFPKGKYDDLTDSATQAISYLRSVGCAETDEEAASGLAEHMRLRSRIPALYPV